jgi:hypothetical protein
MFSGIFLTLWQVYQIGRIFAHCVIVYFGQFLKITEVAQILWNIMTKYGLGHTLGDFFAVKFMHSF